MSLAQIKYIASFLKIGKEGDGSQIKFNTSV